MKRVHRVATTLLRFRMSGHVAVLWLGVAIGVLPAQAQRTTFAPVVFCEEARNGNVAYLGSSTGGPTADWVTRVGVLLALNREGRSGQAGVHYLGSYEKYQTFTQLDHSEHTVGIRLFLPEGRQSTLGFTSAYTYGQTQGTPGSLEAADRFLSQRVTRRVVTGTLRYDWKGSGLWSLWATARGSRYWFHTIEGATGQTGAGPVEDRRELGAQIGVRRALSPRTEIGWLYGYTDYDLAISGFEKVHEVAMTFGLGLGKNTTVGFQVGAFQRRGSTSETGPQTVERGFTLNGRGGIDITRTGPRFALTMNADRSASNGGSLQGTSTDTTVGVTVRDSRPVRWVWSASARYVLRESTRTDVADVRTAAVGGTVERVFRNTLAARLTATYVRQFSANSAFVGSAPVGAIGLVWSPRRRELERIMA